MEAPTTVRYKVLCGLATTSTYDNITPSDRESGSRLLVTIFTEFPKDEVIRYTVSIYTDMLNTLHFPLVSLLKMLFFSLLASALTYPSIEHCINFLLDLS